MKYKCKHNGSTNYGGKYIRYKEGENDVPAGSLDHVGSCEMISKSDVQNTAVEQPSQLRFNEDYPGYDELKEAGYDSVESVDQASDDDLLSVDGIGPATLKKIRNK